MGLKTRLIGKSLTICPWVANDLDEHAHEMDEKCVVAYVCMENIYAAAGMETEANRIKLSRVENQAW